MPEPSKAFANTDAPSASIYQNQCLRLLAFSYVTSALFLIYYVVIAQAFPQPLHAVCAWDCDWYMGIAKAGYSSSPLGTIPVGQQENWAFFPAFPELTRLIHLATGAGYTAAALALNNVLFPAMLAITGLYGSKFHRINPHLTILVAASLPTSLYYHVPYSETCYGILLMLVLLLRRSGRLYAASLCAALFTASRPTAAPILAIIGLYQWEAEIAHDRSRSAVIKSTCDLILFGAIGAIGLMLFMLYLHFKTGDALAFAHVQSAWHRTWRNPLYNIIGGMLVPDLTVQAFLPGHLPSLRYMAITTLLGIALSLYGFCANLRREAAILLVTIAIATGSALFAMPRLIFASPVAALLIASCLERLPAEYRTSLLCLSAMIQAAAVMLWYQQANFLM
ncbi:hypothetical protein [Acidisoma silvae]|uniref:Glycosyltransferase RgtA/B/C/D-like domain-containing protein n=1 Tax=Acidisoma silvae TaxID=2802396 RepID=A0A963YT21_9PROT|nr:hypothetical protein [Acidisoma silvae]MCB8876538.1 hypothetical protein [Acidisoma silvae]